MRLTDEFMQRTRTRSMSGEANEEYRIHPTGVSGDTTHRLLLHIQHHHPRLLLFSPVPALQRDISCFDFGLELD